MQRIIGWIALLAAFLAPLAGCTTMETPSSAVSANEFRQSRQEAPSLPSKLAAGDALEVSVELDGRMEVMSYRAEINHRGMATLPLVGDVKVGGSTLDSARQAIADAYGAYYVNKPVVMLSLLTVSQVGEWGAITVMGRVGKPGRIPLRNQNGMNLTEAIQMAGGFSASAKKSGIRVSRTGKDGKKLRVSVDYEEIGQGGNAEADIKLIDGDIVYVPERIF